jgi:hypothetical protein
MLSISIKVTGLETFPGQPQVRQAILRALRRSTAAIRGRAAINLSGRMVAMRSGRLRLGLRSSVRQRGQDFIATVRDTVFYGHILEEGAAAHLEKAKRGALKFQAAGHTIFVEQIVHPGLRPRRWFSSAVQEALPELRMAFEQELGAVTRESPIVTPGAVA